MVSEPYGMTQEQIDSIAQRVHSHRSDDFSLKWGKQSSKYRNALRKDVRSMLTAMELYGFKIEYPLTGRTENTFSEAIAFRMSVIKAREAAEVVHVKMPPMPVTVDRRSYDEEAYPGLMEGNKDWADNNNEAVEWLADNHAAIREALNACPAALVKEYTEARDAYEDATKPKGAFGHPKSLLHTDPIVVRYREARAALNALK